MSESVRSSTEAWARLALVAIGFAPLWVVSVRSVPNLSWLAEPLDWWFSVQCHRAPSRSLDSVGCGVTVCARCMGVYSGLAFGALFGRPRLGARAVRLWMCGAIALMALEMGTELLALRPPNATLRGLTGLLLSYPAAIAVVEACRRPSRR